MADTDVWTSGQVAWTSLLGSTLPCLNRQLEVWDEGVHILQIVFNFTTCLFFTPFTTANNAFAVQNSSAT